jgi:phospholipase C
MFGLLPSAVGATPTAPVPKTVPMPLKHFVYIIQENISFDHYFGTYPGANGIPKDAKFAYQPGGAKTVAPFHLNQTHIPHDLNHSWQAAHVSADDGKMDGFLWGEWPQALAYYWKGTLPQIGRACAPALPLNSSIKTTTPYWMSRNSRHS